MALDLHVEVVRARLPAEAVHLARKAQFLAELLIARLRLEHDHRHRQRVAILLIGLRQLGVVGDRGQLHPAEVVLELALEDVGLAVEQARRVAEVLERAGLCARDPVDHPARAIAKPRRIGGAIAVVLQVAVVEHIAAGGDVVVLAVLDPQVQLAVGAKVGLHRAAQRPAVLAAQILPVGVEHARQRGGRLDVAIRLGHAARHAHAQALRQRTAHRAFDRAAVEAFVARVDVAVQFSLAGVRADVLDQAARRVAPEQRALRPAQHFHALDVEQLARKPVHRPHVGIIDINRDRRFEIVGEVVLRNAAQVEDRDVGRPGVELEPRHLLGDLRGVGHAQRFQLLARIGGDRDRHALRVLAALVRGDDDIAEGGGRLARIGRTGLSCGILRPRGNSHGPQRDQRNRSKRRLDERHGISPTVRAFRPGPSGSGKREVYVY